MLSGETCLYPIIGDPIRFVKSPQRMSAKFNQLGHNGICVPMQVPEGALENVVRALGSVPNVRGLVMTMPHKKSMFAYCATSSETSKLLGAVSVVRRNSDNSWHGDMLDGVVERMEQFVAGRRVDSGWQRKDAATGLLQ
jgi:shikimate 5-dehydrogenase